MIADVMKVEIKLLYLQESAWIIERNKILKGHFKKYLPYYRKKLKEIDEKLNQIHRQIYFNRNTVSMSLIWNHNRYTI